MAIICNLKSQYTARDYTVVSASHGWASVELRNPSAAEDCAAFEVEVSEVINVRTLCEDGSTIEMPDHLRVERRPASEYEAEFYYPGALM